MSETIDVEATEVYETRSGWQAEDQIAVEYLEACLLYTSDAADEV